MDASPKMSSYLPQSLVATGLVVGAPVVAVWALRADQVVGSTPLAVLIGAVLSIAVSFAGSTYWANSRSSRDVLFSELMLWGWLRRRRAERKLTAALTGLAERADPEQAGASGLQLSMLKELAGALEAGDPYTRGHSRRVARYATMIAKRIGLGAEDVNQIRTAAAVHDVGKVYTPIEVLHKPGRLTDEEYSIIKAHPVDGARLVEALRDDRLTAIVRHHHERLDGRGYPSGLSGTDIPLGARIVAVADTFDAITSARSYRPASPHRKALDILTKEAGTQLDADAVRAFRACYTGRRPFAMWVTLLAFPQRLSTSLGNTTTAGAVSISKAVVAASTVAVVGGAAASAAPLVPRASSPRVVAGAAHSPTPGSSPPALVATGHPARARSASEPGGAARLGDALTIAAAAREHSALRRLRLRPAGFPKTTPRGGGPARSSVTRPSVVPGSGSTTVAGAPSPAPPPVSTVAAAPSSAAAPVPAPVSAPARVKPSGPRKASAPGKASAAGGSGKGKGNTGTKGGNTNGHHGKDGTTSSTKSGGGSGSTEGAGSPGKGAGASGKGAGSSGNGGNGSGSGKVGGNGNGAAKGGGSGAPTGARNGAANGNGNGNGNGAPAGDGNGAGKAANGNGNGNADSGTTGVTNRNGNGNAGASIGAGAAGTGTATFNGNPSGNGSSGAETNGNGNAGTNGNGNAGTNGNGNAGTNGNGNAGTHHGD